MTQVYFWTTIRKNRSKYNLTRGIAEDDITNILLHKLIVDRDVQAAESSLLQLPGLRKFHSALKSNRENEDFRRHMRKYISIWLPDCPFEVSTTNRYTIVTHEAAVTARREIKKGETVKYLVGNLVAMTPEEEKDLDFTRRDFSIVMSSRKKTPSLFLGPARFANHDCNANARLVTRGPEGMQVVAARDIGIDEEITVTYGDNYFGEGNCECLCLTCEKAGRGAWAGAGAGPDSRSTPLSDEDGEPSRSRSLRQSTRKRSRTSELLDSPATQAEVVGLHKRRKMKAALNSVTEKRPDAAIKPSDFIGKSSLRGSKRALPVDQETSASVEDDARRPSRRQKIENATPTSTNTEGVWSKMPGSLKVMGYQTPESSSAKRAKGRKPPLIAEPSASALPMAESIFDELSAALKKKKPAKAHMGKTARTCSAGEQAVSRDKVIELLPPTPNDGRHQPMATPISSSDHDSLFGNSNPQVSSPATTPRFSVERDLDSKLGSQPKAEGSDVDLSELDPNVELDDGSMTVVEKSTKRKRARRGSKILPTIEVEDASLRIPGDYTRTSLLLGEKYSRWVDCRTCSGCWVQQNGYQTRKECPRCERHSKLYGFQYPKTQKNGEDDEEERVMDHRTVHRFINPHEERLQLKRGKGCNRVGSGSTSRTNSVTVEGDKRPVSRLRESARVRRGSQLKAAD